MFKYRVYGVIEKNKTRQNGSVFNILYNTVFPLVLSTLYLYIYTEGEKNEIYEKRSSLREYIL